MAGLTAATSKTPDAPAFQVPSPDERPDAEVVIYDGECRFCQGQVAKLHAWDRRGALAYLSLHDPRVAQRYPDLDHDDLMQNMVLVDRQGRRYRGADAVRAISRRIPRLWWLTPIMYFPGTLPVWQFFYRKFAKTRYRWGRIESCDNGSCKIPGR